MRRLRSKSVVLVVVPVILLFAGLLLGLAGAGCAGQTTQSQETPAAALSPAVPSSFDDVSPAGLDAYIQAKMKVAHVPGLAACVVSDGEMVWAKGCYGALVAADQLARAGRRAPGLPP